MVLKDDSEVLLAADAWGFRDVDPVGGTVAKNPARGLRAGGSSDIAANDTAIALANVRLGIVQKLDRASEKVLFETREIKQPYGVALLDDGAVAVADIVGKRIARVDAAGTGTIAAGFDGPVGLARGADGALLVTDAYAGTLTRVDPATGARTEIARGLRAPEGLALMTDGRIAVAETGAGRLTAVDPRSRARETLADGLPFGAHVTQTADRVGLPAGVAAGRDGAIYVSCDGDFSIRKVTWRK
jgi:sugar lactone lactonase YvrE